MPDTTHLKRLFSLLNMALRIFLQLSSQFIFRRCSSVVTMKFALILYFAVMCLKKSYSQSCVVGGPCTHGFIPGTYKLDNQCSYFKRLHSEETYTHTWCGFDGERAIICCPEDGVSVRSSHDEVYDEQQTMESLCKSFKIAPVTSSIRIFGGTESLTGEFPHFTLLGYRKATGGKTSFDCGGTLISSKHVLTAAHCCRNSSGLSFVRLGAVCYKKCTLAC